MSMKPPQSVLITGASGKTGLFAVLYALKAEPAIDVYAGVRSEAGETAVRKFLSQNAATLMERVHFVRLDVTDKSLVEKAFKGMDAVIICTGAQPKVHMTSIPGFLVKKMMGRADARPTFSFTPGAMPEQIDYQGALNQIDAAVEAGVQHLVLLSSIATLPKSAEEDTAKFVNSMGGANTLVWKRKSEEYLQGHQAVKDGKLVFTIVRPGGLLPHHGTAKLSDGGVRPLHVTYDDAAFQWPKEKRMVPRADVGRVLVDCLSAPSAKGLTFDVTSSPPTEGEKGYDGGLEALLSKKE